LINALNGDYEFAHGLEEDRSSSLIGHLNKLHDAHLKKILKSKFGEPLLAPQMSPFKN